jgi:hypothetical protein
MADDDELPFTFEPPRSPRRPAAPSRSRGSWVRRLLLGAVVIGALALGVAIGNAAADRPQAPNPVTVTQKVRLVTVTETVASVTRTVVVTG